jgi:ribosomal protein S18 acetylase RimI-like enzyme
VDGGQAFRWIDLMDGMNRRVEAEHQKIYRFLLADPISAAYAIGDLEPEQSAWCRWHLSERGDQIEAVALVYERLDPPILLTFGSRLGVEAALQRMPRPQQVAFSVQPDHLPALSRWYDFSGDRLRAMVRMTVTPEAFEPALLSAQPPRRLGPADVPAIEALYACGGPYAPDSFSPAQVAEGVFYGLDAADHAGMNWTPGQPSRLLAVAGTHLVAPGMGMAAVGNIYVDPRRRGRGYGRLVAGAVTAELLERDLLVVLNVDQANRAAIDMYVKLGYRTHCPLVEGIGVLGDRSGRPGLRRRDTRHRFEEVIAT